MGFFSSGVSASLTPTMLLRVTSAASCSSNSSNSIIMEGGIESEWDSFRAQLDRMGLKEYIEIYQKSYDAYLTNL